MSILGTHYRQPLDWNLKILEINKKILENWYSLYSPNDDEISNELLNILLDDLNTPKFITSIHSLYNKAKTGDATAKKDLNSALKFLGLFNENQEQFNILRKKSKLDVREIENKSTSRLSKSISILPRLWTPSQWIIPLYFFTILKWFLDFLDNEDGLILKNYGIYENIVLFYYLN